MTNGLPYLYFVGPVCGVGRAVLCVMCSGELMSCGNVDFMSVCIHVHLIEFYPNFTYAVGCNGQEQCLS
jgi:hypothetical protein